MEPSSATLDRFASRRSTVVAPNGIVATSQPLAASAGLERLRSGGNAFDAAVTAAAALNVVEPTSTGLGGDVFALYRTADGTVGALRSCGGAPADATRAAVSERVDGDEMPFRGPLTVTVPGTARGWETIVESLGRGTLADALDPAISYAREGFPVTEVIASHWQHAEDLFTEDHARDAYLPGGSAPSAGEQVTLPALGASLQKVAEEGADVVYEGSIADAIVAEVQSAGGLLDFEDLASFEPEFVEPITGSYRGAHVYELPPNNQGPIVLEAIGIADALEVAASPPDSLERTHRLIEAMKLAYHDGHHWISDPEHVEVPRLWDESFVADRADRVGKTALDAARLPPPGPRGEPGDTVLVTVADAAGNLVSLINSRFAGFGSGLVAGETGIALQNRGASFSLDPSDQNVIAPGKRPFHTLIPGLVRFGADDWAAFGVMGGHMQPQGHVQVLTHLIDGDDSLQAALDRPRWRYYADGSVAVEPRMDPVLQSGLVRRGHDVRVKTPTPFGGAQIVRRRGAVLSGASEPRKDGMAVGY